MHIAHIVPAAFNDCLRPPGAGLSRSKQQQQAASSRYIYMAKCNGPKYSRVPAEEWGHRSVHLYIYLYILRPAGGSTGVSLDAHPAHRQPSTSPSARYWAEGPAEGQASGSGTHGLLAAGTSIAALAAAQS
ncbi:hypothetical protein TEQG_02998 [Trichophyton equinum CBS 127.97]|uniref:Uncharacterized protein n=1 Tax=Trichophyton equinum (strain ATCC MYA-4606 / CBS 127.97) TaxID=559882 RepID=F2PPZ7_TRIEC|nr:hypothetical protein TEQG_02998 [Trichophyton equinum CBS 127.97]